MEEKENKIAELILMGLVMIIGKEGEDWEYYETDPIEWTAPRYYHQN